MDSTALDHILNGIQFYLWDYFRYATAAFLLFYVLLKKPLWFRKIQQKMPKLADHGRDIFYTIVAVSVFAVVNTIVFYYLRDYTNLYSDFEEYGTAYYIFSWVWMFLLHDTLFYWSHRAMHHPKLFKHVHLVHHKSHNPTPWTALAVDPLEALIIISIIPILAFSLPLHVSALSLYFIVSLMYSIYAHLGFELLPKGFHKTWIGRYFNSSVAHNLHHDKFHGNYGFYFLIWDRLMGTVREDYDSTFEKTTERGLNLSFLSKDK